MWVQGIHTVALCTDLIINFTSGLSIRVGWIGDIFFFQVHSPDQADIVYELSNPCTNDGRSLYFISDPPHLMKTVRNCWVNDKRHLYYT